MSGKPSCTVPKISVVMGVHNGAATLSKTIDSILAQSSGDFELLVVDDGSTDETDAILAAFAARDPRVRVVRQESNLGLTRALIRGCALARGPLIARHDSGDLSHPRRLEVQQGMLDVNERISFVSSATQYAGPQLEPLWITRSTGKALIPAWVIDPSDPAILRDGPTHHGSVMFRRTSYEQAGGYRASFYYGQDFDLWYRLAEIGMFQITNEVLYTARVSPTSISSRARTRQNLLGSFSRAAFRARMHGEPENEILAKAATVRPERAAPGRRAHAGGLYSIGEALRRNRDPRATHYLREAFRAWPFSPRTWLRILQDLLTF